MCPTALRQGCSFSPVQFATSINELTHGLTEHGVRGIQLTQELVEIFILPFVEDVALLAEVRNPNLIFYTLSMRSWV